MESAAQKRKMSNFHIDTPPIVWYNLNGCKDIKIKGEIWMSKKSFLTVLIFLVFCVSLFSEIPQGYYDPAKNLKGKELKKALYNIIKDHTRFPYTAKTTDVWDILKDTDQDPNNHRNVILLYSGQSVDAKQEFNKGKGWEREHVWSQSHGEFGRDDKMGAGTDVHHLRPVSGKLNKKKLNRFFDEGGKKIFVKRMRTGSSVHKKRRTFEPRDAVKGDVARMIFYMAVRYEGEDGEPDLELTNTFAFKKDNRPLYGRLGTLILWHFQDPVDDFERRRNDIIFEKYQKNRNPFIDHPEFVYLIWLEK
jgi:endonuclease I